MTEEKTKEAFEALETLESIAHMNLHGSVETSQFKCVDTIRATLTAPDVNAELLEACNVALGHMTGGMYGDWRDCDPIILLRDTIARVEQKGCE